MTENFVLIHRGRVVASGNIHEIRNLMDDYPHRILIRSPASRRLAEAIVTRSHVLGVEVARDGKALHVQTDDPVNFYTEIPSIVIETDAEVEEMISEDDNLNAVFRYLVSR